MNNLIQTHTGDFHADEISAIALWMKTFGLTSLFVTENLYSAIEHAEQRPNSLAVFRTPTAIANFAGWTFDIGGVYNVILRKLDHHHNPDLPATNILVLNLLHDTGKINEFQYNEWLNVFSRISDIDVGKTHGFAHPYEFTKMINSFLSLGNQSNTFHKATIPNTPLHNGAYQ